ncbi:MAG: alpha-glucosidase [Draconibacterium sp.]|nr:MAG: alpha-glucosidase [Draconibacterium sp.]
MKKLIVTIAILPFFFSLAAKVYIVTSPNGRIEVKVNDGEQLTYAVSANGDQVIAPSAISLQLDNGIATGKSAKVKKAKTVAVNRVIHPVVSRKYAKIEDNYNLMTLKFKDYSLEVRAYDEGMAFRWHVESKSPFKVVNEEVTFAFPDDRKTWFPEEESMFSHQERSYVNAKLSEITPQRFCSTGMLVDGDKGRKIYISESDLMDYPGMFLQGSKENPFALKGKFAGVVLETEQTKDRDVRPVKYADYIAECQGSRNFPWRALLISEKDADLVQSELIYKLAPENVIKEYAWIKPGKVAWDWWNACNIYGVDFQSGVNNDTYKYYIDFAAKYGLEYVILDEGWYHLNDIMDLVDDINVQELVNYGKKKNVGIILWVVWKTLDDKLEEALDQFEKWGVKGIKIDFMQRDDQWMVNFYEKIARECAKRHLLVDYHGAYKPSGLNRKYPNVISFEGVKGMENCKWSDQPDPEHNVTLPFIRMVAGAMDYTPGAMLNATKKNFNHVFTEPMSPGTRCHQLGMYVVFESPLQMLSDNPSNYYREPECMEFLKAVPTVWDDTHVLKGKVGDYIAMARKSGERWFVGAMTDWSDRELNLKLDFLPKGSYAMEIWKDGINATKHAADFARESMEVNNESEVKIKMAPGGGWVAIITKK